MNTALFTLFIHFCTPETGCETKPLGQWPTLAECQAHVPVYYALVQGDYLMECK